VKFILDKHISPKFSQLFLGKLKVFVARKSHFNLVFLCFSFFFQFVMLPMVAHGSHPQKDLAKLVINEILK
jgi:hypothetical protein